MTRQEIFDKCVLGLAAQKWEQSWSAGHCRYRGPNGLKCAIGQLIPDELVPSTNPPMYNTLNPEIQKIYEFLGIVWGDSFLCDLQRAHDSAYKDGEHMRDKFERIARQYGLIFPKEI